VAPGGSRNLPFPAVTDPAAPPLRPQRHIPNSIATVHCRIAVAIASAAAKLRAKSFTLDGEAVVAGADGIAVFDALHRRRKAGDAILYAFDLLELDGADLRALPLVERKAKLAKLLTRAPAGIVFNEHTDEDGTAVFQHACKMGLEGIVSKRLTAPYRSGPSRDWIKVKNPDSPAMRRHQAGTW
jgi:bifunctional non-homologous end joining protein LigD